MNKSEEGAANGQATPRVKSLKNINKLRKLCRDEKERSQGDFKKRIESRVKSSGSLSLDLSSILGRSLLGEELFRDNEACPAKVLLRRVEGAVQVSRHSSGGVGGWFGAYATFQFK